MPQKKLRTCCGALFAAFAPHTCSLPLLSRLLLWWWWFLRGVYLPAVWAPCTEHIHWLVCERRGGAVVAPSYMLPPLLLILVSLSLAHGLLLLFICGLASYLMVGLSSLLASLPRDSSQLLPLPLFIIFVIISSSLLLLLLLLLLILTHSLTHSSIIAPSASAASRTFRSPRPCATPAKSATSPFRCALVSSSRLPSFHR